MGVSSLPNMVVMAPSNEVRLPFTSIDSPQQAAWPSCCLICRVPSMKRIVELRPVCMPFILFKSIWTIRMPCFAGGAVQCVGDVDRHRRSAVVLPLPARQRHRCGPRRVRRGAKPEGHGVGGGFGPACRALRVVFKILQL